ncbi:MAG: UDP-glucose 4-epimerase GalE [Flavobacteriales bacterium AspAUS03]
MKQKILVTGGLGYIGSHTVVALQEEGYGVVIIDDLSNSSVDFLDRITSITGIRPEFEKFDLMDQNRTRKFFDQYSIDGLIHFAAFKSVGESVKRPLAYYQNNLFSLIDLLQIFQERELDHFIFSSSCTVYGQANELPIKESALVKPAESPYGKTKQMSEEILKDYTSAYDKKVISLRYFNPIGAHPSGRIGELPLGVPQNLIPFITQTAIGKREELLIFGGDYPTSDGTAVRDYIHVCDLARAHVAALRRLLESRSKTGFEVFNLGTGKGHSVLEVVKTFEKVSGLKLNFRIIGRRRGDIIAAYADTKLANETLRWQSKSSLSEALRTAWLWEKR